MASMGKREDDAAMYVRTPYIRTAYGVCNYCSVTVAYVVGRTKLVHRSDEEKKKGRRVGESDQGPGKSSKEKARRGEASRPRRGRGRTPNLSRRDVQRPKEPR